MTSQLAGPGAKPITRCLRQDEQTSCWPWCVRAGVLRIPDPRALTRSLAQADLDDFEDLEIEDPSLLAAAEGPSGHNEEEEEIKPMDAFQLTSDELMAELERKGIRAKGFQADDAKTLQAVYDSEHEDYVVRARKEAAEKRARAAKQAGLQRKRMLLEKQLREEQEECAKDSQLETWLIMVRQDSTTSSARISVNSITCRALAKASVPR